MADDIAASSAAADSISSGAESVQSGSTTAATESQTQSQGGAQPQSGEPPRERWDSILSNARTKAAQEARQAAESEFNQRFQPYKDFETDPWTAVQQWLEKAERHSVFGPMVKQHYQSRQQQAHPQAEPQPDVPIVDGNGQVTGKTYSAERLNEWQQWHHQQNQAALDARLSPLEARAKADAEREQVRQLNERSAQWAAQTMTELRKQPYFKENEQKIGQALLDHKEFGSNIHQAYNYILATEILPNLSAREAQSVINSLQDAGNATTVAPGTTTAGKPKFKSYGEAAEYYSKHPDEAAAMAGRR